jgi:hypothetical protein
MVVSMNSAGPDDEEFRATLVRQADSTRSQLGAIETQMGQLTRKRTELEEQLEHIDALLNPTPDDPAEPSAPSEAAQGESVADMVVDLLRDNGKPMHYRDIEQELRDKGTIELGGRDPANTLLARYFKDERLYRPARGTYALRDGKRVRSVGTRRKRKRD